MIEIHFCSERNDSIPMRTFARALAPAVCLLLVVSEAFAQRGGNDWMTISNDAQRSNWVRSDGKISVASMSKPGFEVVWKLKPQNGVRQLNSLTPPSMIEFYISHRGFRSLGFFGASGDRVIGVDTDLGRTEWEKSLSPTTALGAGTAECPGGLTAAVTRPTGYAYPAGPMGRGAGRSGPPKGDVGEPHEGAVILKRAMNPGPPRPQHAKPAPAKPGVMDDNPFAARVNYAVALASDGQLHMMWISNGFEASPAIPFIPAGANAAGLISYEGSTYVSTLSGCPGVDSGVWAIDMTSKKVSKWKSAGKGVVGTAGQATGPDGTVFVSGGDGEIAALAHKTLEPLRSYKTGGAELTSSPVVFEFKGKDLVAATSSDGKLHLVDASSMSSALDKSEQFSSEGYAAGALATWQDPADTRWILAPAGANGDITTGAVVAFKVVEKNGAPGLEKGWTSRELVSPVAPVVVNGVVFALSSGESRKGSVAERVRNSKPAVLYALDALSGQELWNSGAAITSFVHSGTISVGGSRVFLATHEGTQYVFSFPMEH